MRTPPPVLPPEGDQPEYKQSWLQRQGPDSIILVVVAGRMAPLFPAFFLLSVAVAVLRGMSLLAALGIGLVAAILLTAATAFFIRKWTDAGGAVFQKINMPSGRSTPYEEQFSYQETLAARGDVTGALESYEAIISERADAVLPRLRAAELCAKSGRDLVRATELFRSVRDMPGASARDILYASNRLVDLYNGPLRNPGRALVELRRIVERFPNSADAKSARGAIPGLKARNLEERDQH